MTAPRMARRGWATRAHTADETVVNKIEQRWREKADSRMEVAGYIAQMTSELSAMAATAQLDIVAHFLLLARAEAELVRLKPLLDGHFP